MPGNQHRRPSISQQLAEPAEEGRSGIVEALQAVDIQYDLVELASDQLFELALEGDS